MVVLSSSDLINPLMNPTIAVWVACLTFLNPKGVLQPSRCKLSAASCASACRSSARVSSRPAWDTAKPGTASSSAAAYAVGALKHVPGEQKPMLWKLYSQLYKGYTHLASLLFVVCKHPYLQNPYLLSLIQDFFHIGPINLYKYPLTRNNYFADVLRGQN